MKKILVPVYVIKRLLKLIEYKILPIKKNLWVFTSFEGQYSDSPKYISERLYEVNPSIDIVWLVDREKINQLPQYVKGVDISGAEAKLIRCRASVIVDNIYGGNGFYLREGSRVEKIKLKIVERLVAKKGQHIYTTWHGTPLKRMGRDQIGNKVFDFVCPNTTMLLGNSFTLDIMRHLTYNKIQMELIGSPRNDILFKGQDERVKCKIKLGLPNEKKIFLYAPTFRNDGVDVQGKNVLRSGINQLKEIDLDELFRILNVRFGGDWLLVLRFHYHVTNMVDWEELNEKYDGRIINGNVNDDMAEYLMCTDVLLTDASSCMFDFAITKRPCFIYFPDLDNYQNKERGFYLDINSLPFSIATTFDELATNMMMFDEKKYIFGIESMLQELGYNDDEKASERIVDYILGER